MARETLRSPVASLWLMAWLREQHSVPTFTTPSKRIAVLSLAGLGDMLSPPAPNHAQSSGRLITS
ncbi:MAG: hypothetical protein KF908_15405 [Nitrosomonas sp.]|nr:hypothetical protein [Nitrosomonas sp.]